MNPPEARLTGRAHSGCNRFYGNARNRSACAGLPPYTYSSLRKRHTSMNRFRRPHHVSGDGERNRVSVRKIVDLSTVSSLSSKSAMDTARLISIMVRRINSLIAVGLISRRDNLCRYTSFILLRTSCLICEPN